jgi:hypothetical protein
MAEVFCLDSIKLCALRVTALTSTGHVSPTSNNYATTDRETRLGFTADVDQGKDLYYRNACDNPLAAYKSQPLLKRFNMALDLFGIDPAVNSLLLNATVIDDDGGDAIGFEFNIQDCPSDPGPGYVAIEAWAEAQDCDEQDSATPYYYYLFPITTWQTANEWTLQTDFLQPAFGGFTRRNTQWGHGPYGGVTKGAAGGSKFLTTTGAPAVFLTSDSPPAAVCGFQTVVPSS